MRTAVTTARHARPGARLTHVEGTPIGGARGVAIEVATLDQLDQDPDAPQTVDITVWSAQAWMFGIQLLADAEITLTWDEALLDWFEPEPAPDRSGQVRVHGTWYERGHPHTSWAPEGYPHPAELA